MARAKIRVVLVDDHVGFRAEARRILHAVPGIQVVAEAGDVDSALIEIRRTSPDVVVLDLDMRGADGFDLAAAIRAWDLPAKLVLLSVHCSELLVRKALTLGIEGCVAKESTATELAKCVKAVHRGVYYVSAPLARMTVRDKRHAN
jgi:DNA-binding NarL/FixJ family response regulator